MSRGIVLGIVLGAVAWSSSSWGQAESKQSKITGTVSFRQRVALPLDAAIDIRLEEVSSPGAPAKLVSESVVAAGRDTPTAFELPYDAAEINPAHAYQVRATLTSNGTLLFTSAAFPVITRGAPASIAIVLQPVGAPVSGPSISRLQGTYWKLTQLAGQPAIAGPGGKEAYMVLREGQKFTGSTGCNDISGTYAVTQSTLTFTPVSILANMCSPEMTRQEKALLNALKATRRYRIQGESLELRIADEVLASFQARKK